MDSATGRKFSSLSPREREVIGLAAAGLMDKQIGPELDVSLNTLRTYWSRIREKVGDEPRTGLVAAYVAEELGDKAGITFDPQQHEGWVMDAETRMVHATDNINDQCGLQRGIAHPVLAYMDCAHPEDAESVRDRIFEVAGGSKDMVHLVFRFVTPRGIELVNSTIQAVKGQDGKVKKVYCFRMHTVDCRPGRNPAVRVGHWEEEEYDCEEFTIDEDLAQILGSPVSGMVRRSEVNWRRHPDDEQRVTKEVDEAVAGRREHLVTDVKLLLADGSVVWGRATRRFDYQKEGKVRIFGTFSVFE